MYFDVFRLLCIIYLQHSFSELARFFKNQKLMDTVDTVKKHVEDNEVWKPLVEKSLGVNFRNKVGLLEHQKLMIAADVADDDEISCPFMESFGKTSSSGYLSLC